MVAARPRRLSGMPSTTRFAGRDASRVLGWCVIAALLGDVAATVSSVAGVSSPAQLAIGGAVTLAATRLATSPRHGRGRLVLPLTMSAALAVLLLIPTVIAVWFAGWSLGWLGPLGN